eukprot:1184500-Lingulodinium_polyedra.AAC.1
MARGAGEQGAATDGVRTSSCLFAGSLRLASRCYVPCTTPKTSVEARCKASGELHQKAQQHPLWRSSPSSVLSECLARQSRIRLRHGAGLSAMAGPIVANVL